MKRFQKLTKFWLPVVFWATVIFVFSSFPTHKASQIYWQDFIIKKTVHLIEYGTLFILLYRGLKNTTKIPLTKVAFWAMILVILYAMTDEYHQSFTSGREPTARDVAIDSLGALLAWSLVWKLLPKAPTRLKSWAKNWQLI